MKILMLGWELPPHNSGGLGVACYQLCKTLTRTGVDIEFILPYHANHNIDFMTVTAARPQGVVEVIASGIAYDSHKYVMHDGTEEWVDIYTQAQLYGTAVERLVEEREFDIIHAHDWLTFRAAIRAKERSNKPMIAHIHSVESDRCGGGQGNPLVREIEETAMLIADKVIAVSQHTKNAIMRDYNIPGDKIDVVHNSIDIHDTLPLDPTNAYRYLSLMKSQGYKVVSNVGRLTIQKGLPNLLLAAKEVVARLPKTIFLIVGSGEQYYELIEQAADLGISENVVFTGFQRGKNWRDSFAIADLFVMPSISEPFGLTPLEAAGYGTPSLISRQSGVAEVLSNCLKVDFWDVNEMANQMVGTLRSQALQAELRMQSQSEYQRLSWQGAADSLVNLYQTHAAGVAA